MLSFGEAAIYLIKKKLLSFILQYTSLWWSLCL